MVSSSFFGYLRKNCGFLVLYSIEACWTLLGMKPADDTVHVLSVVHSRSCIILLRGYFSVRTEEAICMFRSAWNMSALAFASQLCSLI